MTRNQEQSPCMLVLPASEVNFISKKVVHWWDSTGQKTAQEQLRHRRQTRIRSYWSKQWRGMLWWKRPFNADEIEAKVEAGDDGTCSYISEEYWEMVWKRGRIEELRTLEHATRHEAGEVLVRANLWSYAKMLAADAPTGDG
jgi:hypothetical protein